MYACKEEVPRQSKTTSQQYQHQYVSSIKKNNSQCSFEPTVALKERIKLTLWDFLHLYVYFRWISMNVCPTETLQTKDGTTDILYAMTIWCKVSIQLSKVASVALYSWVNGANDTLTLEI